MSEVLLVYGDEPQRMEEVKGAFLASYTTLNVRMFDSESSPRSICEAMNEQSLFGDVSVLYIANPPIIKKTAKQSLGEWQQVYDALLTYNGESPVLLMYHESIDKRIQANKALLAAIRHEECHKLKGPELLTWVTSYCKKNGYTLTRDGMLYLQHVLELWQDVPVSFLRTEFDRYFLQLGKTKKITEDFLRENSSDYGAKNIFAFKDALLQKNAAVLMELFPFMLSYKEIDRALSYIESQLRLQLMVSECRAYGMSEAETVAYMKDNGSTVKPYPIKLAYSAARSVTIPALAGLLRQLYEIIRLGRMGEGQLIRVRDACLTYCLSEEEKI